MGNRLPPIFSAARAEAQAIRMARIVQYLVMSCPLGLPSRRFSGGPITLNCVMLRYADIIQYITK
jgi:hypothetical protein